MFSKNQWSKESPSATQYFRHYPSNFLNHYGLASSAPGHEKIMRRTHPVSCEWLKRPGVAMSEFAETMVENMQWLRTNSEKLMDTSRFKNVHSKLRPFLESLSQLNRKNTQATPKPKHAKKVLKTFYENDEEVTKTMMDMVQFGRSMFLTGIQYLVVKELLSNPEIYAEKMVDEDPNITLFKSGPSVAGLLCMLNSFTCEQGKASQSSPATFSRNLINELKLAETSGKRKSRTDSSESDDSSSSSSEETKRKRRKDKKNKKSKSQENKAEKASKAKNLTKKPKTSR